jgi:phosphohistidine phosphatase SixA
VTIYLVRHAKAGSRRNWAGNDALRPLSKPGRRQSEAIAQHLADGSVTRIVSSPFVRCVQTVDTLAQQCGLPVDVSDTLAEGAPVAEAVALLDKLIDEDAVLCSHGDVIGDLLMHFSDRGVRLDDFRLEKASIWVLDNEHGRIVSARYVPPPSD